MAGTSEAVRRLPVAGAVESAAVVAEVLVPLVARGLLVRRPAVTRLAERLELDRRAVRRLQVLRARHGTGPVRVRLPGRRLVIVLSPEHVHDVLARTPEPFAAATREKRAALRQFQPHGVLASGPRERPVRRALNERVLDTGRPVHRDAAAHLRPVLEEVGALLPERAAGGDLDWDAFARAWWRLVRRLVLGDGARDDERLTDDLRALRAAANWSSLRPPRTRLRASVRRRLEAHLTRAEPGSLAAAWADAVAQHDDPALEPVDQVPQWLFAFDATGMATLRALALLATAPDVAERVRAEAAERLGDAPADLPLARACVLESTRLWPTTPAILRETTRRVRWPDGPAPEGTAVVVHVPFLHRDDQRVPAADRFEPALWSDPGAVADLALVPFSEGPASCAGRDVALHVASTVLALLVRDHDVELVDAERMDRAGRLPANLDPFTLRFRLRRRAPGAAAAPGGQLT